MKKTILNLSFLSFLFMQACTEQPENLVEKQVLSTGWSIQQSSKINAGGETLSASGVETSNWYACTVPTTIMGALTQNGLYADAFVGTNYVEIDTTAFDESWWYRTEFTLSPLQTGEFVKLNLDGISYYANVWLNGQQIASREELFGAFRRFSFDITPYVAENNVLAVEVFHAQPGDPNIGFVDWNPRPADENMGIFREVYVSRNGKVDMRHTRVTSRVNTETLKEAWLAVETRLTNETNETVSGKLTGEIGKIRFSVPVTLLPKEEKRVSIDSNDVPKLHIKNPRLWWCNNLGNPELYELKLRFETGNAISASENLTFGIREIKDYYTEDGHRGFMLNGKKVLIKSAGWTDDIFLRDTPETNEIQAQYVKDMNMNSIRFENVWGTSQNIYDMCDKYGLMALVGWSCHWEWENYLGAPVSPVYGGIITPELIELIAQSFEDQVLWLRNHPSIIAWFTGSDRIPHPDLETRYMKMLATTDDRPYCNSAGNYTSEITGASGMKMAGPYEYVAPNYWYIDRKYGGAFGFNTETGIGAQLPVIESIRKFIPEDKLWPIGNEWSYHCTTSTTDMHSLRELTNAMDMRYGEACNLENYLLKADLLNYEGTRAMFEAFRANIPNTTGIVQWMLNSAWPSLYWQMYDYYLIPTAAYYGVKKSNLPQQLIYNYAENALYAVNEYIDRSLNGRALVQLYSFDSKLLAEHAVELNVPANNSLKVLELDQLTENIFLNLKIEDQCGAKISDNFYWISAQQDEYDWDKTNWYITPISTPANFKPLADMPQAEVKATVEKRESRHETMLELTLENQSPHIAFFINFALKDENGERVFPIFWNDNYISLMPNEKRTFVCKADCKTRLAEKSTITISGYNVEEKVFTNLLETQQAHY